MKLFGQTDIGLKRKTNQDAFCVGELEGNAGYAVVCDGIGGTNGGQIASQESVKVISEQITQSFRVSSSDNSIKNMLITAVNRANVTVFDRAAADQNLAGMGTTVDVCLIHGGLAHIAHVGDGRTYLIASGTCTLLTTDHSIVQEMMENGEITKEQMKTHPDRHIITRAVGVEETLMVDYCENPVEPGQHLLLCTDGLSNYIEPQEMADEIDPDDLEKTVNNLIELAKSRGGADNITAAVIAV